MRHLSIHPKIVIAQLLLETLEITLHNICEKFEDHCSPECIMTDTLTTLTHSSGHQQFVNTPSTSATMIRDELNKPITFDYT